MKSWVYFVLFLLLPFEIVLAATAPIRIHVTGLRSTKGQVAVSVFSSQSPDGFPGEADKAIFKKVVNLDGKKELDIQTDPLEEGKYAIALMHDENSDSKFETNFIGIPKEGFGFSNNPSIRVGPPSIKKALIEHPTSKEQVAIEVKYML